jgi:hypothetical protein
LIVNPKLKGKSGEKLLTFAPTHALEKYRRELLLLCLENEDSFMEACTRLLCCFGIKDWQQELEKIRKVVEKVAIPVI